MFFQSKPDIKINPETLVSWTEEINSDPTLRLAGTLATNVNVSDALINRHSKSSNETDVFSNLVTPLGSPRMNQKSSGRCWLFAATNTLRIFLMRKYNLDKFELSPAYLFFYDKLEKANFFLDQVVKTADLDLDSRLVQHLLSAPVNDGGQWGMFANIVEKYGLVPMSVYPESANTVNSTTMNSIITTLLRQYAQELRLAVKQKRNIEKLKQKQLKHIHELLTIFLGTPPAKFDFEYLDKDNKFHRLSGITPREFYTDVVGVKANEKVSLLNDPRNEFNRPVKVKKLGNVVENGEVYYFNTDIDVLTEKAINRIKNNKPTFFGTHTPIYHHNATGIIDTKLWDYDLINFKPTQSKADRLRYGQSLMTHAMTLVGVHLDVNGEPVRWKVENSWGEDMGRKGYYTMSHDFFKEYVYQIVVDKSEVPEFKDKLGDEPIELEPWDPCGALA